MTPETLHTQAIALQEAIQDYDWQQAEAHAYFKKTYLGRQGAIAKLFSTLATLPLDKERKAAGAQLNATKATAAQAWQRATKKAMPETVKAMPIIDPTLPSPPRQGSLHILTQLAQELQAILGGMGFNLADGPHIEDEWHNFTALGILEGHPAREMQDTFFIDQSEGMLLRTQTSSIQVRTMQANKPPIRTISLGRCFRNETISARSHCTFHQIEGLYIDHNVSFVQLKATLYQLFQTLFGKEIKLRLRPSFFPFTEPSAEVDVTCLLCKGNGCTICKQSGWVEVGGAGMVDPHVLTNGKIDPERYQGFAFGMGLERIAMLRHHIDDLRLFTENDLRFLKQFAIP